VEQHGRSSPPCRAGPVDAVTGKPGHRRLIHTGLLRQLGLLVCVLGGLLRMLLPWLHARLPPVYVQARIVASAQRCGQIAPGTGRDVEAAFRWDAEFAAQLRVTALTMKCSGDD